MEKYVIELGTRKYKFRVKESGNYGHLVEVILDEETLEYLKSIGTCMVTEEGTTTPEKPIEVKETEEEEIVKEEVKAPTQEEKKEEPKVTTASEFTDIQVKAIKNIKEKMKVDSNEGLNPFINEWTLGQQESYKYLNKENIDGFIGFMNEQYLS